MNAFLWPSPAAIFEAGSEYSFDCLLKSTAGPGLAENRRVAQTSVDKEKGLSSRRRPVLQREDVEGGMKELPDGIEVICNTFRRRDQGHGRRQ
jgi:hypothetical protein